MASEKTKRDPISPALRRAIDSAAKKAATKAVEEVMVRIGINVEDAEATLGSQADARFVRLLRTTSESRPAQYGLAAFGAVLATIGALVTLGTQWVLFGAPKP